jgi:alpha-glucosidase
MEPHMWPNWVLGNHDRPRVASRVGTAQARVAAMMLLTFRGTPTMYYGDEIGMQDVNLPPEALRDGWAKNEPGIDVSRDPQRTPMQWDGLLYAGFSSAKPWLPLAQDYAQCNVQTSRNDPRSLLSLYRSLIALRRRAPALSVGAKRLLAAPPDVIAFERAHAGERYIVALNLCQEARTFQIGENAGPIVLSTRLDRSPETVRGVVRLGADEGVIIEVS